MYKYKKRGNFHCPFNNLCKNSILLDKGNIYKQGPTSDIIPFYLSASQSEEMIPEIIFEPKENKKFQILAAKIVDGNYTLIEKAAYNLSA